MRFGPAGAALDVPLVGLEPRRRLSPVRCQIGDRCLRSAEGAFGIRFDFYLAEFRAKTIHNEKSARHAGASTSNFLEKLGRLKGAQYPATCTQNPGLGAGGNGVRWRSSRNPAVTGILFSVRPAMCFKSA